MPASNTSVSIYRIGQVSTSSRKFDYYTHLICTNHHYQCRRPHSVLEQPLPVAASILWPQDDLYFSLCQKYFELPKNELASRSCLCRSRGMTSGPRFLVTTTLGREVGLFE